MTYKTKNGRVREQLDRRKDPEHVARMTAGRKRAAAAAPRKSNGKLKLDYRIANVLNAEYKSIRTINPLRKYRLPIILRNLFVRKRILKQLRMGIPYTTVCSSNGIAPNLFLETLERGKNGFSKAHAKFYKEVCKAEANGEINILKRLRRHSSSDWRVNAWQLERIWPEKYGRVDRIRAETRATVNVTTDTKKELGTKVISDDIARELARRMIDGDAQLHFNALPASSENAETPNV